jgi:hypothetical protein
MATWVWVIPFGLGFTAALSLIIGLFFLRFYRDTRDVLFAYCGAAFILDAAGRVLIPASPHPNDGAPSLYLVRAFTYSLILVG